MQRIFTIHIITTFSDIESIRQNILWFPVFQEFPVFSIELFNRVFYNSFASFPEKNAGGDKEQNPCNALFNKKIG